MTDYVDPQLKIRFKSCSPPDTVFTATLYNGLSQFDQNHAIDLNYYFY